MNTGGVEKWIEEWHKGQIATGHILTEPAPALLTTAYAEDVVNGYQEASKWVRLACERHLNDLKRSQEDPTFVWKFDPEKAWRPIRFIEQKCRPSKGDATKLVLQPFQHFFIGCIFGWVHKKTGIRRFTEALVFLGRKNGRRFAV